MFTDAESPGAQFVLIQKPAPGKSQDQAAFRRFAVERLVFMMLNARLFERGQVADPPYLSAEAGRSPYVEPLDIMTFSAWVPPLSEEMLYPKEKGAPLAAERISHLLGGRFGSTID